MKRMIVAMMMALTFMLAAPFSMASASVGDHGTAVEAEPTASSQSYGVDDKKGDDGEKDGEDDKGDDEEGDSW